MTKKETLRQYQQETTLCEMGFTQTEAEQLRKISVRLRSWGKRLCNDTEVDENGAAWVYNSYSGKRYPTRNMGKGAGNRLEAIMKNHPEFIAYHQGDPRGVALYIISKSRLNGKDVDAYYSSLGFPVY